MSRKLPPKAWMALRRLGWAAAAPDGVKVNDRIVRMAQEAAGRALRSAHWRAGLTAGIVAAWPASPGKRGEQEWDAVREAVPGGQHLPSSIITARTRQIARFAQANGRMPADVFELEEVPGAARMLLLGACDGQQATIERAGTGPQRALLRLQLPTRPGPRAYADWTWVACPITLPPTVPAAAVLHLPALRVTGGVARAEMAYTSGHHPGRAEDQPGPDQDRTHPAPHHTPRAQATQGTLPSAAHPPRWQASGGTRTNGPGPAAPRSPPEPERDDDQHTHQPAQATRRSTGRRIPPPRPRHPATVGNDPPGTTPGPESPS